MTDMMPFLKTVQRPHVRRLVLSDFRSYHQLDLDLDGQMIALTGQNGAGKTNILEALSFLSLGRGLRRADLRECCRNMPERSADAAANASPASQPWAISVELSQSEDVVQLGTGFDPSDTSRKCRVNRAPVGSAAAFAEYVRVIWLTPAMDGLFTGSTGDRRRFLDRLVLTVDSAHGSRVNALERALRNRNRLLTEAFQDKIWLDAAEREVAELSIAVTTARHEALNRLQALILSEKDETSPFPWAEIRLHGEIDRLCLEHPAAIAEEKLREALRNLRGRDAASGRTSIGPHISDLLVRHGPKSTDAAQSSTGEQKALLTGLILAHARLVAQMTGQAPLILLDEIAAHFDPSRREALFVTLEALGAQIWMTGADPAAFALLQDRAQIFHVEQGRIFPFAGIYFVAVATPGPGIAALIARVLRQGLHGLPAMIAGFVLGDLTWFTLAAAGLSVVAQHFAWVFLIIKYGGAGYLAWISWKMWSAPVVAITSDAAKQDIASFPLFLGTLSLTLGNPKVIVFFLSIMPLVVNVSQLTLYVYGLLALTLILTLING
eukprot:gene2470-2509_t